MISEIAVSWKHLILMKQHPFTPLISEATVKDMLVNINREPYKYNNSLVPRLEIKFR